MAKANSGIECFSRFYNSIAAERRIIPKIRIPKEPSKIFTKELLTVSL